MKKGKKLKKNRKQRKYQKKHVSERARDFHHLLYQAKHWKQGYARRLRQHPYMGVYMPQFTLHGEIHAKIHDIPTPDGKMCRKAYVELVRREREGLIDIKHDKAEKRLDFLIEMWQGKCPATVELLKWQRDIIHKYYERGR